MPRAVPVAATNALRRGAPLIALLFAALPIACGGEDALPDIATVRETLGDTTIVRTLAGPDAGLRTLIEEVAIGELEGADEYTFGSIEELVPLADERVLVWDGQATALRIYGADGRHARTIGRAGKGPGEIESANGIAVLADGRIGVWDGQNARLTVFTADGEYAEEVRIPGGFFSLGSVSAADSNAFWLRMPLGAMDAASFMDRKDGVRTVRLAGEGGASPGAIEDSILAPVQRDRSQLLQATSPDGRGRTATGIPFSATPLWTPGAGYLVSSPGGEYRIDVHRAGAPLRIVRELPLIPVTDGERSGQQAGITWTMQRTDPAWSWNASIPATKPPIRALQVDGAGRIWAQVSQSGEEFTPDPPASTNPNPAPKLTWREPVVFDVFAPDGEFLGRIPFPRGTRSGLIRATTGSRIWAVLPDSFGVDRVVRWRVEPALGGG